jgi:iron-regulated transporter 1
VGIFKGTLLPASIFGFFTTITGLFFSGYVGSLVDIYPRLQTVRVCIATQKLSATAAYLFFLSLFLMQREAPERNLSHDTLVWYQFGGIVLAGSLLKLSTVGINVAVERDWVMCIAGDSGPQLTRINVVLCVTL